MPKRFLTLVALSLLILLSFAVRMYDLDGKSIWSDEGLSLYRARHDVPFILSGQIIIQGVPTQDTQPPLYFLLLHALMTVAGTSTFVAKFLSVVGSILAVPLIYGLARRCLERSAAVWAAGIAALAPLYLWYAQEIRMYTWLVALSVASVYTLIRAVQGPQRRRWGLAYLFVTSAMLYTHYSGFFLLGFEGLYLLSEAVRRRRWALLAPAVPAGLIAMPLVPFAVRRLGLGPERDFHFVPLWMILRDLWNGFSLGLSVDFYRVYGLDLVFLGVFATGVLTLLRRQRHSGLFLLGYLLVPILTLYAASYIKPMYQGVRHLMLVSPAYYLLLAAGLAALERRHALLSLATAGVLLAGIGLSTANYFTDPRYSKDDLRGLARYFQAYRGPNDVLVLSDAVLSLRFEYYLGQDAPIEAVPRFGVPLQPDFPKDIRALMERYDRLWFMSPHPPVREWLDRNLFQVDEVYFEGMTVPVMAAVYASEPPQMAQPPPGLQGPPTELEGRLAFHGYRVPHNPVTAGEVLTVELFWEPTAPLGRDYNIGLSLLDDRGYAWGQGDAAPFRGLYPTSAWQPGTVIRQRHALRVNPGTPPGTYRLVLWVYDPATGQRLTTDARDTRLELGSIPVVRPAHPPPPREIQPQVSLRRDFGRRLRLLGFDLPTRVRRLGEEVALSVYFQALRDLEQDYRLWLRLIGADGQVLVERTLPPTRDGYPTSRWQAGDILQGQFRLTVPAQAPSGKATVVLSVVDPAGKTLTAHRWSWLPLGGSDVRLGTVEILPPEPGLTAPPPMQHRVTARLGNAIEVLGYDLSTAVVKPGEPFQVTLYWRTNQVIDGNFKVTVQVLSAENEVLGQDDSVPAGWTRPTAGWRPGEVIVDAHTLVLAPDTPPGEYRLITALYDPVSGARLPVVQGGAMRDHVVLGTVRVGR